MTNKTKRYNKKVIVCAACKVGEVIFVGVRHFDMVMRGQIAARGEDAPTAICANQGFLDNKGCFHTRTEAFHIATKAGQLEGREKTDYEGSTTLYSEDLY